LRPVVYQILLRQLESDCTELADVPDAVLAEIFTLPRKKEFFHLVLRSLDQTREKASALAQELRPVPRPQRKPLKSARYALISTPTVSVPANSRRTGTTSHVCI